MTTRAEHRVAAETLLEQADHIEDDALSANYVAQAQVHATLALSAPDGDEEVPAFWRQRP